MEQRKGEIRAGDRVMLRSGGPWMTVLDVGRDTGHVWCRWMTEAGVVTETTFPMQSVSLTAAIDPKAVVALRE
jgi:uncharacterized protein YodC (DUF2158 family)